MFPGLFHAGVMQAKAISSKKMYSTATVKFRPYALHWTEIEAIFHMELAVWDNTKKLVIL